MARIQSGDFDLSTEVELLMSGDSAAGAVVTFLGRVRDFSDSHEVTKLFFEQYEEMALKELQRLEREAVARDGVVRCTIIHRVGELLPGENIVLVIVAGKHRKEAFATSEWIMHELKRSVPLWKKEFGSNGAEWLKP